MSRSALRLVEPVLPFVEPKRLAQQIPADKLIELSGSTQTSVGCARTTTAISILRRAQQAGDTAAWIQPEDGPLYPPDLAQSAIDLDALVVVHVPPKGGPLRLCKAAELLVRSGAFGIVIIDLCQGAPQSGGDAWQGRLLGLARQHQSTVVLLTEKVGHADSLGPLIGLRVESQRFHDAPGKFVVNHQVLKNKSGAPFSVDHDLYRGPWGLQ